MILFADSEGPDQTAQMRTLIWAFAVCICPKTCFRMVRPIYCWTEWIGQQCRSRSGITERGIWSGSALFAIKLYINPYYCKIHLFISNAYLTFLWCQAELEMFMAQSTLLRSCRLTSTLLVHILSPVTDTALLNQRKAKMTLEMISWSLFSRGIWPSFDLNLQYLDL